MNKKQKSFYTAYNNSTEHSLLDAYDRPSHTKHHIEQQILQKMRDDNGYGYRILSHNAHFFTCAYLIPIHDHTMLKVFTPSHVYCFDTI